MALYLTCHQLIFDKNSPKLENVRVAFNFSENESFIYKSNNYIINSKAIDENYFWITSKYGSDNWGEEVIDKKSNTIKPNPRGVDEPELNKQLFVLFDLASNELYLSDFNKKNIIQELLKSKITNNVEIKNFYKDPDEFIKKIRDIKSIAFLARNNLFNVTGGVFDILRDPKTIYGLGLPEKLYVKADFSKVAKTEDFINQFKKMVEWKSSCQADKFVCVGYDDNKIEQIFNPDSFTSKIKLELEADKNGFYDPNSVMALLLEKLGSNNDEAQS